MTIKPQVSWYNVITNEYEYREMPDTDKEARQYISQHPSAHALYGLYRQMGKSIAESMRLTLEAQLGIKSEVEK